MIMSADYETTTDENDCRVWVWGCMNIYDEDCYKWGKDIESFLDYVSTFHEPDIYFHNAKFDTDFILNYLMLEKKFKFTTDKKLKDNEFTILMTDTNVFYLMKIKWKGTTISIYDSYKIIPLKIEKIATTFKMDYTKGEIDYHKHREIGYDPDEVELDYLFRDIIIEAKGLREFFDMKLNKMTLSADALASFKDILKQNGTRFDRIFPKLSIGVDSFIRKSYKGGYCYCNPRFQGKIVGNGLVLDVNSMYPWALRYKPMPCGEPIYFKGKYKDDKLYPLYFQRLSCRFSLKPNHVPTIQIKNSCRFIGTEYLENSGDGEVTLTLTNIDLKIFKEHYYIYDIKYIDGYKCRSVSNAFDGYIDNWIDIKNEATKTHNKGLRFISKRMLNALYGKFGLNPKCQRKEPYVSEDGTVKYRTMPVEERDPIYIPVACFVTAYARENLINSIQCNYDRFLYSDTDSTHLLGDGVPKGIEIDPVKLGAWKIESRFSQAKFLRQKRYLELIVEDENGTLKTPELNVKCAGMPDSCHSSVTFENFSESNDNSFDGKKRIKRVKGGTIIVDTPFVLGKNKHKT